MHREVDFQLALLHMNETTPTTGVCHASSMFAEIGLWLLLLIS